MLFSGLPYRWPYCFARLKLPLKHRGLERHLKVTVRDTSGAVISGTGARQIQFSLDFEF
jgi:hypothetical protein